MATTFLNKVEILGKFWNAYENDEEYEDFCEYNDIGLPLAHAASEGLCSITTDGEVFIEETWELFLEFLNIEDKGFETLSDILGDRKIL
jgi:hypothetical protein